MISRRPRQTMLAEDMTVAALDRIGRELRAARLARGEDLYDIADVLRIRPTYLEALERGDLGPIPGRPYAFGFLKSYADYLDLDGRALVGELKDAAGLLPAAPALVYRTPVGEARGPGKLIGALSILVAAAVYTGWYAYSSGRLEVADLPTGLGEAAALLVVGEDVRRPPSEADDATAPTPQAPATEVVVSAPGPSLDELRLTAPEAPSEAELAVPGPPSTSDAASAQAAERLPANATAMLAALETEHGAPAEPRVLGGAAADGRITLVARASSWVQVRSRGRDFVRTRTLEPGDRLALPNRDDLSLWTGNAGGVELVVDGRSLGVVGAPGQVVRDLGLDADALLERGSARR